MASDSVTRGRQLRLAGIAEKVLVSVKNRGRLLRSRMKTFWVMEWTSSKWNSLPKWLE